jgi:hypothetical protein
MKTRIISISPVDDECIPEIASKATSAAFKKAIASGHNVVIRKGNQIVEVNKNGIVRVIKEISPLVAVKKGTKFSTNGKSNS